MEERYEELKELGAGNFGVARLVRDKRTKELVAVKYIERGKKVCTSLPAWASVSRSCLSLGIAGTASKFGLEGVLEGRFMIIKMGVSVQEALT
jgi:hypothetical protein